MRICSLVSIEDDAEEVLTELLSDESGDGESDEVEPVLDE